MMPTVSVIINCFDGEAFLRQAIESVMAQTFTNWEIIFWDNQSTDRSAEIIKKYKDPRIHYYYSPTHTMLYEARNYAVEMAKGEFLAFLDVDDWWLPNKLECQVKLFMNPKVALVYGNYWIRHEQKGNCRLAYRKVLPAGEILGKLLHSYSVGLLTLMLRRSMLPSSKSPFDSRYHIIGDFDLVLRLAANYQVACTQEPVAVYRIHQNNESILNRGKQVEELERWVDEMSRTPDIGENKNFPLIPTRIEYIKSIGLLLEDKRKDAFYIMNEMSWSIPRLRVLLAIFLPVWLIRRIKN